MKSYFVGGIVRFSENVSQERLSGAAQHLFESDAKFRHVSVQKVSHNCFGIGFVRQAERLEQGIDTMSLDEIKILVNTPFVAEDPVSWTIGTIEWIAQRALHAVPLADQTC